MENFPGFTPLEVVCKEQRITKDDQVQEWRGKKVDEITDKVLQSFDIVVREPKYNAE
jgi:hypothetical protein